MRSWSSCRGCCGCQGRGLGGRARLQPSPGTAAQHSNARVLLHSYGVDGAACTRRASRRAARDYMVWEEKAGTRACPRAWKPRRPRRHAPSPSPPDPVALATDPKGRRQPPCSSIWPRSVASGLRSGGAPPPRRPLSPARARPHHRLPAASMPPPASAAAPPAARPRRPPRHFPTQPTPQHHAPPPPKPLPPFPLPAPPPAPRPSHPLPPRRHFRPRRRCACAPPPPPRGSPQTLAGPPSAGARYASHGPSFITALIDACRDSWGLASRSTVRTARHTARPAAPRPHPCLGLAGSCR
jgi:hypothetical protein